MKFSAERLRGLEGTGRWWRRLIPLLGVAAFLVAGWSVLSGRLIVNFTASIPRGVYWISPDVRPQRGDLVVFPIPASVRDLLYERRYVPKSIGLLAKPVTAIEGDHVCVRDQQLLVNGHVAGRVLGVDRDGKPMPRYGGCSGLSTGEIFVSTQYDNSFDSRHFGPIPLSVVRGTISAIIVF